MASRSHRSAPNRRRTLLVSAAVVATVGLVVSLVLGFRPDREADAGQVVATPVASTEVTVPPTAPKRKPSAASPSPSSSPSKSAGATTPAATTEVARPSAKSTPRTASGAAPLAGRIRPKVTYQGVATRYDAGNGDGACSFGPSKDFMTAAMNHTDYETSRACGAHVLVRAANGATVTVRITNECPLPCAPGQLDLSEQAFAALADPVLGRIPITWSLLSPSTSDTVSIRYKTGSSRYWCAIQAIGHRNPLARLEVRSGSGWRQLPRTEYNYFLSESGSGCGGEIRITDIYGERLTVGGIALRADVAQPTRVQFAAR
ncbi:expansin EXLX1 family cellulose-binding protein [Streptomyces sp. NPDC050704]|uniref:expansin EXLX1 family cellulose-binding protein n=1 Tax=Streptomyces sp. NPDC050704 TaxID=3157219 RepID=UPI0034277C96